MSLRLNSVRKITSNGLLSVVVGCKNLSALHLTDCDKIDSEGWLEYLGLNGSLEELAVNNCEGISHHDLLKFGPGWMKLQKFMFEMKDGFWDAFSQGRKGFDPSYDAHNPSTYDFCCESLKDLRLAHITFGPEIGLRVLLGKCKALERLWLEYVNGLNDNDMIALSRSCSNLRSISLCLTPQFYDYSCRTSFTDDSLKALALSCPMLQAVELTFYDCDPCWPSEIGFTLEGLLVVIQSCPVSVLVLNGANFFNDEGMEAILSAPFLETLELVDCVAITDAGMRFVAYTPCLTNLTLGCVTK
ncbi:hypothetical protein BRADI_4g06257v3 [Brachypodium distachyon]|uniref:Uncharacterized protein n=1 Tax=Brachypodium distachyon TaxID=15368 RepID=A0A0Q3EFU1_BRADI|nr:hypothetical protein BRADI_4g06257v3 [Brachypodium distachyon]PNT62636.1 hypothetical protein BRADI_4g06257v3 [Brachypodium distachyon]